MEELKRTGEFKKWVDHVIASIKGGLAVEEGL